MTTLAHIDADRFFASVEEVFDPGLLNRPLVILSNNDGCVVARSKRAKEIGIPMSAPLFEVRGMLERHKGVILSSNYPLYDDMSGRFQCVLDDYSPDIEPYSVDEAFLIMPRCYANLIKTGREIRRRIRALSGIPVSVGFGPTKTLAKLATEIAKTSDRAGGVVNLYQSPHVDVALHRTEVRDVWGVGRKRAEMLIRNGITTALQLRDADDTWIRKEMTVVGLRTVHELRGIQCIPFETVPKTRRQICCSRTFGAATSDINELRSAVAHFTAYTAAKLREHNLLAGSLTVFVVTDLFKLDQPQHSGAYKMSIAPMSNSTLELLPLAMTGLHRALRDGFQIRKAGVILDDFVLAGTATRRLWDVAAQDIHRRLMDAMDALNERFGGETVRCGLYPSTNLWRTRSDRQSPNWTTDWNDIMTAH